MGYHSDNLMLALGSTKQWKEQKSVGVIIIIIITIITRDRGRWRKLWMR